MRAFWLIATGVLGGRKTFTMKSGKFLSSALGLLLFVSLTSSTHASWQSDRRLTLGAGRSGLSTGNAHCVAADSLGNIHVVWHDDEAGNYEIEYAMFDSLSAWPPQPRRLTTNSGISRDPSLVVMPDTSVFVVWLDDSNGSVSSVSFARFYPHADALLDSGLVSTGTLACSSPCVALASDSSVHVVWTQSTGHASDVFYREWKNGWIGDPLDLVSGSGTCVSASVASDGLGNVHVVWTNNILGNYEIYHTTYAPGSGWSSIFQVSKSGLLAWSPSVGVDADGNAYVVWSDKRNGNFEIYFRRYLYGIGWGYEKRLSYNSSISTNPSVTVDREGNLHIVWEDFRNGNDEIYYRRVSSSEGSGWDPVETRLTSDAATSWDPSVVAGRSGDVHVVWADNRDLNFEIYYKLGIQPVLVGMDLLALDAECTTEGILVRWEMDSQGSIAFFDIYREDDTGSSLTKITQESLFGEEEFLDTHVSTGVTYQYFLGILEGDEQVLYGPVSIRYLPPSAAASPRLAVWPNPSRGPISVTFTAEKSETPFRLALVDVAGRTVGKIASGSASVGVTSLPWDPVKTFGLSISPGVYFVTLEMGGERFEKKVVFIK